jgi:hypothetical protein
MKKFSSVIALVIVLALSVVCFASCDLLNGLLSGDDDANKVTVSWYQGSNLLKEEKVEKGSKLTPWTPEVEGKTFTGCSVKSG